MAELLEAIMHGIALVAELFVRLVLHSVSIISYALFPAYRRQRRAAWAGQPWRKCLELGFSAACLAGLAAFAVYASLPPQKHPDSESVSIRLQRPRANEDLRFQISGVHSNVIISIRTNGLSNILATKTRHALSNAIRQSVTLETTSEPTRAKAN